MKDKTLTFYKKRAWTAFSKYIRISKSDLEGYVRCYTCDGKFYYKKAHAGHGIGGRNNAVLFMEEVVKPQCVGCNMYGGGKYAIFTRKLIDELGLEKYDELVTLSNQAVKYTKEDYENIKNKYTELLRDYGDDSGAEKFGI